MTTTKYGGNDYKKYHPAVRTVRSVITYVVMPNKIDTPTAMDLRVNHGLSYRQIAKLSGTCHQAIHQKLKKYKHLLPNEATHEFIAHRSDIFAHQQLRLISAIDEAALKRASVNNLAYAFSQFYNAERLERGLSTSNVDLHALNATREQLERERQSLLDEIERRNRVTIRDDNNETQPDVT